jgi:threonine dehydratase
MSQTEIKAAAHRIQPYLPPTPLVKSVHYSERLGADIYLKLESLQPTHSFKVRGAFNAALSLSNDKRNRGLVTATGGNHGLALAHIARELETPATIFVPESTTPERRALIQEYGARVIVHGRDWDDANDMAVQFSSEEHRTYIHPFDNRQMIAGAGTIVPEIIEQIGQVDLIVAAIGGGGLIAGILEATRTYSPGARVVGVETKGADSMYQSVEEGQIIELSAITSIVTSLAARQPGQMTFEIVKKAVSDLVTVSDKEAVAEALILLENDKLLVEPAASCCLAALTSGKVSIQAGEKVVVIMCGGNISLADLQNWSQRFSLSPAA